MSPIRISAADLLPARHVLDGCWFAPAIVVTCFSMFGVAAMGQSESTPEQADENARLRQEINAAVTSSMEEELKKMFTSRTPYNFVTGAANNVLPPAAMMPEPHVFETIKKYDASIYLLYRRGELVHAYSLSQFDDDLFALMDQIPRLYKFGIYFSKETSLKMEDRYIQMVLRKRQFGELWFGADQENGELTKAAFAGIAAQKHLEALELGDSINADPHLKAISEASSLRKLVLSPPAATAISDESLAYLGKLINLEQLDIHWGLKAASSGFRTFDQLQNLKQLHVQGAGLQDKDSAFLRELKKLEYLNVADTRIGDTALRHIGQLTGLKTLYVSGCPETTPKGVVELRSLTQLERLSINSNCIDRQSASVIANLRNLKEILLRGRPIDADLLRILKKANPKLDIFDY